MREATDIERCAIQAVIDDALAACQAAGQVGTEAQINRMLASWVCEIRRGTSLGMLRLKPEGS